jgi:hypothetical protein
MLGILTAYIKVQDLGKTSAGISSGTCSLRETNTKQEEIGGGKKEGKETSLGI